MKRVFWGVFSLLATTLLLTGCTNEPTPPTTGGPEQDEALKLEILETGYTSVKFRVTPLNEEMTYMAMIVPKEMFDGFESDIAYIQDDLAWFETQAIREEITLEEFLERELNQGVLEATQEGLDPDMEYYLYAYGLTSEGLVLTDLHRLLFSTLTVEQVTINFEIEALNIGHTSANIRVTPDSSTAKYFVNVFSEADFESWGEGDEGVVEHLNALRNYYLGLGASIEQIVGNLAFIGTRTLPVDKLRAGTKYYAYAIGVDDAFFANSKAQFFEFETLHVESVDMTFDVAFKEIGYDSVSAIITPTNSSAPYICSVQQADATSWFEDDADFMEALISDLENWYGGVESALRTGEYELSLRGLNPLSDYIVVCFGYNEAPTTPLYTFEFRTGEANGNPEELVVSFDFEEITHNSVIASFTPSVGAWYFASYIEKAQFEDLISEQGSEQAALVNLANDEIDFGAEFFGCSRSEYLYDISGYLGKQRVRFTQLSPATEYIAYAIAVDITTGELAAQHGSISAPFTTLEKIYSGALVDFEFGDYYDGSELAKLDPAKFLNCSGYVVVPYQVTHNSEAAEWYTGFYSGDYTEWGCNDDDIYATLITYGYEYDSSQVSRNSDGGVAVLGYDTAFSFLGIAHDSDGNYGHGTLEVVCFSKEGVSPAEEFISQLNKPKSAAAGHRPARRYKVAERVEQPGMKCPCPSRSLSDREVQAAEPEARKQILPSRIICH